MADQREVHPVPHSGPVAGATKISRLARSGNAVVFVQEHTDATTTLFFFANASTLGSPTATLKIDGTPVGGTALSGTTAAVFTFKGINLADFSSGTVRTLAKSNGAAPLQLAFGGSSVVEL